MAIKVFMIAVFCTVAVCAFVVIFSFFTFKAPIPTLKLEVECSGCVVCVCVAVCVSCQGLQYGCNSQNSYTSRVWNVIWQLCINFHRENILIEIPYMNMQCKMWNVHYSPMAAIYVPYNTILYDVVSILRLHTVHTDSLRVNTTSCYTIYLYTNHKTVSFSIFQFFKFYCWYVCIIMLPLSFPLFVLRFFSLIL